MAKKRLSKYRGGGKLPFDQWYSTVNPDFADTTYYDLRGAYTELPFETLEKWRLNPDNNHLPDTYKLPGHPTFSNESKYYKPGMSAVRWEGDTPIPLKQMQNTTGGHPSEFRTGGKIPMKNKKLPKAKDGHWIEHAHLKKGLCTPMTKSTCTPRRKALARTFKKHHGFHEDGGMAPQQGQDQQMQQLAGMVAQALQQGQQPQQIMQALVRKGVPPEVASQVVQMVVQQMQGQQQGQEQGPSQDGQGPPQGITMKRGGKVPCMDCGGKMVYAELGHGLGDPNRPMVGGDVMNGQQLDISGGPQGQDSPAYTTQLPPNIMDPLQHNYPQVPTASGMPNYKRGLPNYNINSVRGSSKSPFYTNPPTQDTTPAPGVTNADLNTKFSPKSPWDYFGTTGSYHGDMAAYNFNKAGELNTDMRNTTDPGMQHQDAVRKAGAEIGGVGHTIAGVMGDVSGTLGAISAGVKSSRNYAYDKQRYYNKQREERAPIEPYRGGDSQFGNPVMSKYGRKLPRYRMGGIPVTGNDFNSDDPNVMTERGETISDPNQGPMMPNGQPTGAVVHDQTGDEHSDPSGGNQYKLGPESVIHSKSLGVKVGTFLEYAKHFPNAAFIMQKVEEKFKDPDKEVSFAKLAALFDTKKLAKEVVKIGKKAEKADDNSKGNEKTGITKTTAKLNKSSLANDLDDTHQEIAQNSQATGADGPIYNMAEDMKHGGAYGKDVKEEAENPDNAPAARYGKKMRLPKYKFGGLNKEAIGIPTAANSNKVTGIGDSTPDNYGTNLPDNNMSNNPYHAYIVEDNLADVFGPNSSIHDAHNDPTSIGGIASNSSAPTLPELPTLPTETPDKPQYQMRKTPDDFTSEEARHIWDNYYTTPDTPFKDQTDKGFASGFNAIPDEYRNSPKQFMHDLQATGFAPKDWTKVTNEDIQNHLYNYDLQHNNGKVMKLLYEDFNQTRQGNPKEGPGRTEPWDVLGDKEKHNWYIDNKMGVRVGDAVKFLKPWLTPEAQTKPIAQGPTTSTSPLGDIMLKRELRRGPYHDALFPGQIAGEVATLFDPYESAPYIENQGAKYTTTRQRNIDDTAAHNRITRGLRASTLHGDSPSENAENAANTWTAHNELTSQTTQQNAQLEQAYNALEDARRERAGGNKATALDTTAQRTAKGHSAFEDRWINAVSGIGNKETHQLEADRAATLYQDMFDARWDPRTGTTLYGSKSLPLIGGSSGFGGGYSGNPKIAKMQAEREFQLREAGYTEMEIQREMTNPKSITNNLGMYVGHGKSGGKIGKLPRKKLKSVN